MKDSFPKSAKSGKARDLPPRRALNPLYYAWDKYCKPYSMNEWMKKIWNGEKLPQEIFSPASTRDLYDIIRPHRWRKRCVQRWAWAIPTAAAIQFIKNYSPKGVVEIGAGSGYWARLIARAGTKIVAFDRFIPGSAIRRRHKWYLHPYFNIRRGGPSRAASYPKRTLLLCWPPFSTPMAYEALISYRGDRVIYIGEGEGGCNGDEQFFTELSVNWEEIDTLDIPQWDGLHDRIYCYKRKPAGEREKIDEDDEEST